MGTLDTSDRVCYILGMASLPPLKRLTAKEENFAQFLFQGYSQLAAFRLAYPNQKGSVTTLTPHASRRAAKDNVKARLFELRNAAAAPAIADVVERKSHATGIMREREASRRDQLAANRLIGEYEKDLGAPNITNVDARQVNVFGGMPTEMLERLADPGGNELWSAITTALADGSLQAWLNTRALRSPEGGNPDAAK